MISRCIKTFHSKRDNSHWCQNSNQRKFLEHSCLIITVSLPTLFLLTHHFLSPLSLSHFLPTLSSLSLWLFHPLSFSYWCQISNLLKFLDNHLWTWLFSLPTFYLFSFPLFILTLSLPTFSLFSHFFPPNYFTPLSHPSLFTPLSPYSHPSLPTLTPISLLTPTSSLSYSSHIPVSHTNLLDPLSLSSYTLLSLPSISYHSHPT